MLPPTSSEICYTFTLFQMTQLGQIKKIFLCPLIDFYCLHTHFFLSHSVTSSPKIKNDTGILLFISLFAGCRISFVSLPTGKLSSNLFVVYGLNREIYSFKLYQNAAAIMKRQKTFGIKVFCRQATKKKRNKSFFQALW